MKKFLALAVVAITALVATSVALASSTTVKTAKVSQFGTVLVGPNGHSLYYFAADKGKTSTCSGMCATFWPPLTTTGKPTASGTVKASLLGTTTRSGGVKQVTYDGHPVYYFADDKKAGQTAGQDFLGFGARWYLISPSGAAITKK